MKVVITGMGAISAMGNSVDELWQGIKKGKNGISRINGRFNVETFQSQIGALVNCDDEFETDRSRLIHYGCKAATEALEAANLRDNSQVALVLGTCNGILGENVQSISNDIAQGIGLDGLVLTCSTACASSAHAIALGFELLRNDYVDCVLAGGADILTEDGFAGFHGLGLLSETPCAPFSEKTGTTLGEGAGFIVMEKDYLARQRGVEPIATLVSYGFSADAYHDTRPDPHGNGVNRAITVALRNAALPYESIDYVNAHGTGTLANDAAEWRAIERTFGARAHQLPVSSSKSFLGHTQGASGVLESITTIISMQHDVVPPTLNYVNPRPNSPIDPVADRHLRSGTIDHALCTNAAFGGVNVALIYGRESHNGLRSPQKQLKLGVMASNVTNSTDQLDQFVPKSEIRGLDRSARLLAGAMANTLSDAGIRFRSAETHNLGLLVSQQLVSPESYRAYGKSKDERGIEHASSALFTKMVVNHATGVCGRIFGVKGPTATMASNQDGGLVSLVFAANMIKWQADESCYLVGAVDESEAIEGERDCDQGASVLLGVGNDPVLELTGWGLSSNPDQAVEMALNQADLDIGSISEQALTGDRCCEGLEAFHKMMGSESNGNIKPALIVSSFDSKWTVAVIVEKNLSHATGVS